MPLWLDSSEAGAFSITILDFSSTAVEFRGKGVFGLGFVCFSKNTPLTISVFQSNTQTVERHNVQLSRETELSTVKTLVLEKIDQEPETYYTYPERK